MKTELTVIVDELRCYIPQADAYNGKHIHKGWARRIEQIIANHKAQRQAEPYAYAVYFPDQPTEELVHDLDALADDLTNRHHTITALYTAPQPADSKGATHE